MIFSIVLVQVRVKPLFNSHAISIGAPRPFIHKHSLREKKHRERQLTHSGFTILAITDTCKRLRSPILAPTPNSQVAFKMQMNETVA